MIILRVRRGKGGSLVKHPIARDVPAWYVHDLLNFLNGRPGPCWFEAEKEYDYKAEREGMPYG